MESARSPRLRHGRLSSPLPEIGGLCVELAKSCVPGDPGMTAESRPEPALRTQRVPLDCGMRNRLNSQKCTGPQSARGKEVARGNALVHGLIANPAAGVVESLTEFEELLAAVNEALRPRDLIECGLTHRAAVALWRLLRAARIDGALSTRAVRGAVPAREIVQEWIERINGFWRVELSPFGEDDPSSIGPRGARDKARKHRFIRPVLGCLDTFVRDEVMTNGNWLLERARYDVFHFEGGVVVEAVALYAQIVVVDGLGPDSP